jgi:DNA-binding MarR family transcriptional regulator
MSLNRPQPPGMKPVAELLAMDRTTLTAALKPLQRRKLIKIIPDPKDKRGRLLMLTPAGHKILARAVPIWKQTHATIEISLPQNSASRLRDDLMALSW